AEVAAGLERNVDRGAFGVFLHRVERSDLRMGRTGLAMPSLADDPIPSRNHTPDARVGIRGLQTARRQLQGTSHGKPVEVREHALLTVVRDGRLFLLLARQQ